MSLFDGRFRSAAYRTRKARCSSVLGATAAPSWQGQPVVLTVYEPGVQLIVSSVRVDRDRLRLFFTDPRAPESTPATSFTIQWPTPFSRSFSEREAIETLIRQYIQPHHS